MNEHFTAAENPNVGWRRGRGRGPGGGWRDGGFGGPGGPFGGPFGGGRGGGRGRARRGSIRAAVLALLAEKPMHGYEMIQELETRTNGLWRPSPGAVYPALSLLEDEGLIHGDDSSGKRRFELTDEGRAELAQNPDARPPWTQVTDGVDPANAQLRDFVGHIMMASRQVAEAGTEPQKAQAAELLADTRRKLYAILAGDQ